MLVELLCGFLGFAGLLAGRELDFCFPRDTVRLPNVDAIRSSHFDELIDCARESDPQNLTEADPPDNKPNLLLPCRRRQAITVRGLTH